MILVIAAAAAVLLAVKGKIEPWELYIIIKRERCEGRASAAQQGTMLHVQLSVGDIFSHCGSLRHNQEIFIA